jgi:hypothetical protein
VKERQKLSTGGKASGGKDSAKQQQQQPQQQQQQQQHTTHPKNINININTPHSPKFIY